MQEAIYLLAPPGIGLPEWTHRKPFNAVVVATCAVSDAWQDHVSDWLVRSGCLVMMAWGVECSVWDDTVDHATRKLHGPGEIPDQGFVLTYWYPDSPLQAVFWSAQFDGKWGYADQELDLTLILDIGHEDRSAELLAQFTQARDWPER